MSFKPLILDTVCREEITSEINLCLRETGLSMYKYAINFFAGSYISDSYYFTNLEEAQSFYDLKLIELRQALKFTEGGTHESS